MIKNGPFGDAYNYMSVLYLLEQVKKNMIQEWLIFRTALHAVSSISVFILLFVKGNYVT